MTDEDAEAQFAAELRAAGLLVSGRDRELLYQMWLEHRPQREALRAATPGADEEPWW